MLLLYFCYHDIQSPFLIPDASKQKLPPQGWTELYAYYFKYSGSTKTKRKSSNLNFFSPCKKREATLLPCLHCQRSWSLITKHFTYIIKCSTQCQFLSYKNYTIPKSTFCQTFKVYYNFLHSIFFNNLRMDNFRFICQNHIWIHHIFSLHFSMCCSVIHSTAYYHYQYKHYILKTQRPQPNLHDLYTGIVMTQKSFHPPV